MIVARLGEVARINPLPERRPSLDEIVSFVPMAELDARTAATSQGTDRPFHEVQKGYTVFSDGDLLVAKITPCFQNNKIGRAQLRHPVGVGSTEFHVIRPLKDRLDARYALYFLRQSRILLEGERRMTGSGGQRRVPADFLAALRLPLPPLAEQRRIAAILDQADALRAKRREALAHLDDLTQSIFLDMFGALGPVDGKPLTLGQVADISSGITKGRKVGERMTTSVPYLAVSNVQDRALDLRAVKAIDATDAEVERYRLRVGDLVLTEGGDPDKLGRGTVWDGELPLCIHQNHIFRV